jgi:predicted nucleotidyltransferase
MPPHRETPDLPPPAAYAEGWRTRERRAAAEAAGWREHIRDRLPGVAARLREGHGARRILLFGSLARGEAAAGSDVDLMVEGIPTSGLIAATVTAERVLAGTTVDLVPFDRAHPEVRARAEAEGVEL